MWNSYQPRIPTGQVRVELCLMSSDYSDLDKITHHFCAVNIFPCFCRAVSRAVRRRTSGSDRQKNACIGLFFPDLQIKSKTYPLIFPVKSAKSPIYFFNPFSVNPDRLKDIFYRHLPVARDLLVNHSEEFLHPSCLLRNDPDNVICSLPDH